MVKSMNNFYRFVLSNKRDNKILSNHRRMVYWTYSGSRELWRYFCGRTFFIYSVWSIWSLRWNCTGIQVNLLVKKILKSTAHWVSFGKLQWSQARPWKSRSTYHLIFWIDSLHFDYFEFGLKNQWMDYTLVYSFEFNQIAKKVLSRYFEKEIDEELLSSEKQNFQM